MVKNHDEISDDIIDDTKFPRLNLHISVLGYLEEGGIHFIGIKTKEKMDKENEDEQVVVIVSN